MSDRSDEHGESQNNAAPITAGHPIRDAADISVVHCHACWKYTDDMRRDGDLVHEAVAILVNAGTLAVEKSEAFQAADQFLVRKFNAAARASEAVAKVDPWKL